MAQCSWSTNVAKPYHTLTKKVHKWKFEGMRFHRADPISQSWWGLEVARHFSIRHSCPFPCLSCIDGLISDAQLRCCGSLELYMWLWLQTTLSIEVFNFTLEKFSIKFDFVFFRTPDLAHSHHGGEDSTRLKKSSAGNV